MRLDEASAIVAGLVIKERIGLQTIDVSKLIHPFDQIVEMIKAGKTSEDIIGTVGLQAYQDAIKAEVNVNGAGVLNWTDILDKSYLDYSTGQELYKISHRLQNGESVAPEKLKMLIEAYSGDTKTGRITLADIQDDDTFIPSGYAPFDKYMKGYPSVGTVLIGGVSGSGKTTLGLILAVSFVAAHPDKRVVYYTLEDSLAGVKNRSETLGTIPDKYKSRIEINADYLTVHQLISDAAGVKNLGLVIIDYIDYLVKEDSEAVYSSLHKSLAIGSKELGVPLVCFAQFSYKYTGGLPTPVHFRYTKNAENAAHTVICLYHPWMDFVVDDRVRNNLNLKLSYLIVWKCKGGGYLDPEKSPGAIGVRFDKARGWGRRAESSAWFSLKNI